MNREITPPSIAPPAANYAHAVLSEQPSRWLHTSGVVPTASDGSTPEDVGDQAAVVWRNIAVMLDAVLLMVEYNRGVQVGLGFRVNALHSRQHDGRHSRY